MVDDRKVAELFRDAASDAPPPSFDVEDVLAASGRARARQRAAVLSGSALGIVVLVGGVVVGTNVLNGAGDSESGSAGVAAEQPSTTGSKMTPYGLPKGGNPQESVPTQSPKQGGDESGDVGPRTGSTLRGCEKVDRELAVALAGELPATPSGRNAGNLRCEQGARSAGFQVTVDGKLGQVSVLLMPDQPSDTRPWTGARPHAEHAQRAASGGRTVVVLSEPPSGGTEAPYADRLGRIAAGIAGKF
ncbi:MAG: hypothetical protein GEU98_19725 [Pseudonocardiaceae bacterium]|nr:hypothetical protein [Pseudonocardiaceae bacterium]